MTLYMMISTCHTLETRLKETKKSLSQRYADKTEEHPNIFAINLMKEVKTTRRLKRKLPQDL